MPDLHDLDAGGHEPIDVDPEIPTGICAICAAAAEPEPEPEPAPEDDEPEEVAE